MKKLAVALVSDGGQTIKSVEIAERTAEHITEALQKIKKEMHTTVFQDYQIPVIAKTLIESCYHVSGNSLCSKIRIHELTIIE